MPQQATLFADAPKAYQPRRVVLLDGRVSDSWSEAWRHECEALTILQLPNKDARRLQLDAVRKRRGGRVASDLEDTMLKIWRLLRQESVVNFTPDVVATAWSEANA